jgi:hypothetical protein
MSSVMVTGWTSKSVRCLQITPKEGGLPASLGSQEISWVIKTFESCRWVSPKRSLWLKGASLEALIEKSFDVKSALLKLKGLKEGLVRATWNISFF